MARRAEAATETVRKENVYNFFLKTTTHKKGAATATRKNGATGNETPSYNFYISSVNKLREGRDGRLDQHLNLRNWGPSLCADAVHAQRRAHG